jgi:hypothetical protein
VAQPEPTNTIKPSPATSSRTVTASTGPFAARTGFKPKGTRRKAAPSASEAPSVSVAATQCNPASARAPAATPSASSPRRSVSVQKPSAQAGPSSRLQGTESRKWERGRERERSPGCAAAASSQAPSAATEREHSAPSKSVGRAPSAAHPVPPAARPAPTAQTCPGPSRSCSVMPTQQQRDALATVTVGKHNSCSSLWRPSQYGASLLLPDVAKLFNWRRNRSLCILLSTVQFRHGQTKL